jgi:hypothetical protein
METTLNQNLHTGKPFNWAAFFSFRAMISLKIIQVLYLLVAIVNTFAGLLYLFFGMGMENTGRFIGLFMLTFGNIFWRVWCELIIVFFRINETMNGIEENTKK